MKKHLLLTVILTIFGTIGAIAIIPYQLSMLQSLPEELGDISVPIVLMSGVIQTAILVFVLTIFGLKFQERTGLDIPHIRAWLNKEKQLPFSWKWAFIGIVVSFLGSVLTLLLDAYLFLPAIDTTAIEQSDPVWWHGLLAMLYGGITEELMVRLFGMTFIVWIIAIITRKKEKEIPAHFYWIGIIGATLLFGAGHLPATASAFGGLTTILVWRALLLNGLLGLWFGYIYWRKGLEYAIISHMAADFFLHFLFANF